MKKTRVAVVAAVLTAGIGAASAQTNSAQTSPGQAPYPPTVGSGSTQTQNPYVNPSAAGTQLGHKSNEAAPSGPNVAQPAYALRPSDKTPYSAAEAQKLIEAQGYSSVAGLRRDRDAIWQGMAMHDGRQVHVGLDAFGHVAELC